MIWFGCIGSGVCLAIRRIIFGEGSLEFTSFSRMPPEFRFLQVFRHHADPMAT
jgi:hypothetical protein